MFLHTFRYTLTYLFRQKSLIFWNILFPVLLGTLFRFAFTGMAEEENFHALPVAVVSENKTADSAFRKVIDELSTPGEDQFLETMHVSEEEALLLLENKKIFGILYEGNPVTLSVSAEMSNMKLEQSILNSFVERYNIQYSVMEQIAKAHPENLAAAAEMLAKEIGYNTETSYSDGDMDEMISYFFNLIAMSCLFACTGGTQIALWNQANLSPLGARKCVSPIPKSISYLGTLCATFLHQFFCVLIGLFYFIFALQINFGNQLSYAILTALLGSITGVSFGFCIGCIGRFHENVKFGICMAVMMVCSFLSGLMMHNIRIYVENICPWFNHINPAALISDCFYSLTVYQSHERYFANSITLVIISGLCCLCGLLIVRRKKYAAL